MARRSIGVSGRTVFWIVAISAATNVALARFGHRVPGVPKS